MNLENQNSNKEKNLHEISKERQSLRDTLRDALGEDLPESITKNLKQDIGQSKDEYKENSLQKRGIQGFSQAKEYLAKEKVQAEKSLRLDEQAIESEMGQEYIELKKSSETLVNLQFFEIKLKRRAFYQKEKNRMEAQTLFSDKKGGKSPDRVFHIIVSLPKISYIP